MGWTVHQTRRRCRLRHRPHLETLDDRCLLSTGLATPSTGVVAEIRHPQNPSLTRSGHDGASHAKRAQLTARHHALAAKQVERPAGTLITGAATAYDPIIGAAQTRSSYNVDGAGMTVAVIDTGVDYNNSALGGSFGPGSKVIAGYDFADNSSNPMATSSQHGTAVAGLIGSDDPNDLGVAPGVDIVALRVTDSSNTANLTSIANALQWVINNHAEYNITAVNMSLSDGNNYAQNWFAEGGGAAEQVTSLINQLTAMNIPVVAATGNSFNGQQGEGFPAIVANTISVTATDLSGNLLANAQRLGSSIGGASATTIAAPGGGLTAPSGDSGTSSVEGTSFAAPLVTGSVVLLQQIYESRFGTLPSVAQLEIVAPAGIRPDQRSGHRSHDRRARSAQGGVPDPAGDFDPGPAERDADAGHHDVHALDRDNPRGRHNHPGRVHHPGRQPGARVLFATGGHHKGRQPGARVLFATSDDRHDHERSNLDQPGPRQQQQWFVGIQHAPIINPQTPTRSSRHCCRP